MLRTFSVSIDVDSLACYYRIHGLGSVPPAMVGVIYRNCVERFRSLLAEFDISATFFVVGQDLDHHDQGGETADMARAASATVATLAAERHEIANHSYSHHYNLARLDHKSVESEIGRAHDAIVAATGVVPRGFRAPGYDVSAAMIDALIARGYLYDSSIFPAPTYYVAKAAVMVMMRALGRPSGAVLTNPRALTAPTHPYRPATDRPWRRGDAPLVELPIAVAPTTRIPMIGTSWLVAPRWLRRHLDASIDSFTHFNFELHAIDLADAEMDGLPGALVARQPDLRVPLAEKTQILRELFVSLCRRATSETLLEAALSCASRV